MTLDNQSGAQPPQPGQEAHNNSPHQSGQHPPYSHNNPGYAPAPNPPSMPGQMSGGNRLHGHRWSSNGQFVDVVQLGPSNGMAFDFVADNPGKWLYHCHVTDHMMGGMIGMYEISA